MTEMATKDKNAEIDIGNMEAGIGNKESDSAAQSSIPASKGIYPDWPYKLPQKGDVSSLDGDGQALWESHHSLYKEMLSNYVDDRTIHLIPYNKIPKRTQAFCVTCGAMPMAGLECGLKNRCFGCVQCGCERGCQFTFPCSFTLPRISFTCCSITCGLPRCSFICGFDQCMTWCPCLICCAPILQCICNCTCFNPCISCVNSCCETCKGCNPCSICKSCCSGDGEGCCKDCCPPSIACCKAQCGKLPCFKCNPCSLNCCKNCKLPCCNPCAICSSICSICSPCYNCAMSICSCILPCVTYGLACRNECRAPCCKCIGALGCADGNPAGCAACGVPFVKEILFKTDSPWEATLKKAIEEMELKKKEDSDNAKKIADKDLTE